MTQMFSSDVSDSVREAFNFSVDKMPLEGKRDDGALLPTDQYGLFRSDTGFLNGVKSISSHYVPHTTDDVCALVDAAGEAFDGEIECKTHFRKGHYVSIAPTEGERLSVYGTADNVFPRIVIRAGYNADSFSATMGYYRDACSNLAMMRKVSGTTAIIRHTSSLRSHMDSLIAQFNTLKESWGSLTDVIQRLESIEVRMIDFLDEIYGRPTDEQLELSRNQNVIAVTRHRNRTEAIWKRLNDERNKTGRPVLADKVSAWEAFNGVQGYVQHDAQSREGFKGEFDRILRASNDANVRKAEKLVLALSV